MVTKGVKEVIREVDGEKLIGQSPAIRQVLEDIARLAPFDVTVIL